MLLLFQRRECVGQPEKKLTIPHDTGFSERLKTAAAARKAQFEKFQPKDTVTDPAFVERKDRRAAELATVRQVRADERAAARQVRLDAQSAAAAATAAAQLVALEAKRQDRKLRKSMRRQDRNDVLSAFSRRSAEP